MDSSHGFFLAGDIAVFCDQEAKDGKVLVQIIKQISRVLGLLFVAGWV